MKDLHSMTRREALGLAGGAGAALAGASFAGILPGTSHITARAAAATSCSTLTPEKEPGPFFVDVRLNRSDIRTDTTTQTAQAGIPLSLTLYVYSDDDCTPYEGAVVDIWNANAEGVYSDESSEDSVGTNYLRGYQVTDENGMVQFTTNMPGWYSGRTMHVHVEVRTFDSAANQTFEWQTQLFFGDSVDSAVAGTYPYTTNPNSPRVVDENDRVWQEDWNGDEDTGVVDDGAEVTPALTGSTTEGFTGSFSIVLDGLPATNADGFGSSTTTTQTTTTGTTTSGSGTTSTGTGSTSTGTGSGATPIATVNGFHWKRKHGRRMLVLSTRSQHPVRASVALRRGRHTIAHTRAHLPAGHRRVQLEIDHRITAGAAVLDVVFENAAGAERTVRRTITIPKNL